MSPGRRARLLLLLVACLLWMLGGAVHAAPVDPASTVLTITTADASLEPEGKPWRQGPVDLNQRWDLMFPGRGGRAVYRVTLPPRSGNEPMALFL